MMFETRKILEAPDIGISVTCARVPVIAAHSESVNVQTRDAIEPDAVRELLRTAPGIEVVDDPAQNGYPTALAGAGRDEVLVGRIRRDPSHPRALNLWVVGDNLLKGAATNAIQLAVSGTGLKAVGELRAQTRAVLEGAEPPAPSVYPHPIAFNVLGGAGSFADGDDYTDEERKMMFETRKILEAPDIGISVTCARVPVIAAHSESVNVQTRDAIEPDAVRELLRTAPGVEVVDDPAQNGYPTALAGAGRDEVLVGRIRRDPSHPRALNLWVVGDNLLKGAATNAIQLAEALHERGLIRVPQPA